MSKGSLNPTIRFLSQKVCPVACVQRDMKVSTVGTLSGFQDFFLQSIIKDWPKNQNSGSSAIKIHNTIVFLCISVSLILKLIIKWYPVVPD